MIQTTFAERDLPRKIRRLRTNLGLTQEQSAARVGVSFSTVNRWESGKSIPSPLAMKQIELFYHENEKKTGEM